MNSDLAAAFRYLHQPIQPAEPRYYVKERIGGMATFFEVQSASLSFRPRVLFRADAFDSGLDGDIILGIDHAGNFGSTREGNLKVWKTPAGLQFLFRPRLDRDGERIVERMRAGLFQGVSIRFDSHALRQNWPVAVNEVFSARLTEVTLCDIDPAFPQTKQLLTLFVPDSRTGRLARWDPITRRTFPLGEKRYPVNRAALAYYYANGLLP